MAVNPANAKSKDEVVRQREVILYLHSAIVAAGFKIPFETMLADVGLDNDFSGVVPLMTDYVKIRAIKILAEEFMFENNVYGSVASYQKVNFAFNSASPRVIKAVVSGHVLISAKVVVTQVFDDPAATLTLGTGLSPALIFSSSELDPGSTDTFENSAGIVFPGPDNVELTINPGASTQGAGFVLLLVRS